MKKHVKNRPHFLFICVAFSLLTGCTPTIQLDTPKEGITINMNVVVDHNINVTMDEKTKAVMAESDKK
ncbi:YnbE family lipoprotein [Rodentibacter caecimuris]|uniref:YnbE family lipoprotein n=1 Tax=Rodentibacter caecimuris TaxID=1796644 RepID=UPI001094EA85|nr:MULTISPECIES: YnbE family lipoprotein [Pasteurellaceae]MCR1836806.1 YnbE family lipoprotein [Pasteurella caecimuris]MCU0105979.1 YnbE family lipoprotein [Pasteurella caecimuris]MCX2961538.1 YnbE family lipoprotein [Rodentibacter heylii]TGY51054.1 YnbE family lipoprotein [Pasteurella caecimuris]